MKIIVGSKNPNKIEATEDGFKARFKTEKVIDVVGESIDSGISDQPMSDEETFEGAKNRAENLRKKLGTEADYFVGIEGGCRYFDNDLSTFGWVVVMDKDGRYGKARTAELFLPKKVKELVEEGKELGEADDIVFGMENSKQGLGATGILTDGLVSRKETFVGSVVRALSVFVKKDVYES